jgi:hypothetical protein
LNKNEAIFGPHVVAGLSRPTALVNRNYNVAWGQIGIGNGDTAKAAGSKGGGEGCRRSRRRTDDRYGVHLSVIYMARIALNANVLFLTLMATKVPFLVQP